jgi:hypothetical protein
VASLANLDLVVSPAYQVPVDRVATLVSVEFPVTLASLALVEYQALVDTQVLAANLASRGHLEFLAQAGDQVTPVIVVSVASLA